MKQRSCDVIIIGAGSAGLAARRAAVASGARTILVEAGPGGTTCARVGCMPSKLLLAAAAAARAASTGKPFGIGAKPVINGRAVMARVQRERDRFVADVLKDVAAIPAKEKLTGFARFDSPTSVTVDDHTRVEAKAIVIATGARPEVPQALAETCGERVLTHETVFELKTLPTSMAVIGAGALGLELAIAFARLGVRTCVFDQGSAVGDVADPAVQNAVQAGLGAELKFRLGVEVETRRLGGGDIRVAWRSKGARAASADFEYVLSAAGRPPAIDGLDLKMIGLPLDEHGMPPFDLATGRLGDSAVFMAGDADGARPVLHEAAWQGERAGQNAARYPQVETHPIGVKLSLVYTDPDIALVGEDFTPHAAKAWAIGASSDNGRATVEARDAGLLRIYVRREDKVIIGGTLFGPDVEHLGQMLAWLSQLEMKLDDALALPFYHPTAQEGLRAALRDARDQLG